jgi:hypothetical protein
MCGKYLERNRSLLALQGVNIADDIVTVMAAGSRRGQTDDCSLLRAKCATHSGSDGEHLVLQNVGVADDLGVAIVTLTN